MRSKRAPGATEEEVRNSYNANDDVNKLDWARKAEYIHINEYYKGLIELRKNRPELRLQTADDINEYLHMYNNIWQNLHPPSRSDNDLYNRRYFIWRQLG